MTVTGHVVPSKLVSLDQWYVACATFLPILSHPNHHYTHDSESEVEQKMDQCSSETVTFWGQ